MTNNNAARLGVLAVILVNFIWSGSFAATSIALHHMSALFLTMVRLGTGSIVLMACSRGLKGMHWDARTIGLSFLLGIVGFTLPVYLETEGLALSTPAMAAISIALEPLFTVVIAAWMLKERLGKGRRLALILALFGAWAIADFPRPGAPGYIMGDLLLIAAVLCYGVYNTYSKRLTDKTPASTAAAVTLFTGFLTTIPLWLLTGARVPVHMRKDGWFSVLYLALMATAFAYFLWMFVLERLNVSFAALFLYLQPVFGVIISVLIVGTHPTGFFYLGAVCILTAIYVGRDRKPATGGALVGASTPKVTGHGELDEEPIKKGYHAGLSQEPDLTSLTDKA